MTEAATTVLSTEQRKAVAADETLGGGNALRVAVATNPDPGAPLVRLVRPITSPDGNELQQLSLHDMDDLAQSWSVWYLGQGVRPRDRVAVWFEDSYAYFIHFHALAQIGAIAVLVNSNASKEFAASLLERTEPVGLYADAARLARLDEEVLRPLTWTQEAERLPAPPRARVPEDAFWNHHPQDPVTILHSSGTTGKAKPAIHTHSSIVAGPRFRLVDDPVEKAKLMLTAMPQSHLGTIAYSNYAMLGGSQLIASTDGDGRQLADVVAKYQPSSVMSFGHTYAELAVIDTEPGSLDSVVVWVSIADSVHRAHMLNILGRRSEHLPPAMFYDRLGTTELGWGTLLKVHTLESERNDRCAGKPVGVAEVTILRPDGSHADVDEVGYFAAKGPSITAGYWGDSALTYNFRLNGYWLPGDHAYRDKNGDFFLVDRVVDTIYTNEGNAYSVFMEEAILCDVPEIGDVSVVAGSDGTDSVAVAVAIDCAPDADPAKLLADANVALRAAGHPTLGMLEIVKDLRDYPKGVTGKVLKRQLRERYADLPAYVKESGGRIFATTNV